MEPLVVELPAIRAMVERRFRVYDVQTEENVLAFYIEPAHERLESEFDALKGDLKPNGLVPLLKYQGGEHAIFVLRNPLRVKRGWKLNLVLFAATLVTTTLAGAFSAFEYYRRDFDKSTHYLEEYVAAVFSADTILLGFVTFALPLLAILTIHELGHYFAAKRHGVAASLPFFIPVPPVGFGLGIGTFGAFISMREPMPNRKALFDIGASGPIAGFLVAIPVLLVGFALMASMPVHAGDVDGETVDLGTPLLWQILALPFSLDEDALTHPTAFAGWVGLFVTAINLLPAGQLDGGHISAAMFGERARYASYAAVAALVALGLAPLFSPLSIAGFEIALPGYDGWLYFALLIGFLGIRHPPTLNGVSGLDARRRLVGWATFAIGVLCFTFVPISG